MPDQRQIIVTPNPVVPRSKGTRSDANLRASFPDSPIFKQELSDIERKKIHQALCRDGIVLNGNGLSSYDRDYVGAPNLEDVQTGGGGLPATPYTPNLTSPGPGSFNAADQPAYSGVIPDKEFKNQWGTGLGGLVSPSETSQRLAEQNTLSSYISGRSFQGSDGKS